MPNSAEIAFIAIQSKTIEINIRDFGSDLISSGHRLIDTYNEASSIFYKKRNELLLNSITIAKKINKDISTLNRWLGYFIKIYHFKKVPIISLTSLRSITQSISYEKKSFNAHQRLAYIDKRIKDLHRKNPRYPPKEENLSFKINHLLQGTFHSLKNINGDFIAISKKYFKHNLGETKYGREINEELASVFSIGYPELALFIAGRILETAIKDYMLLLRKRKKINKTQAQINKMKAEDRLNYLSGRWLNEKDISKLRSIKFDRNIVAHYDKKSYPDVLKDAEADIALSINILERINHKIEQEKKTK